MQVTMVEKVTSTNHAQLIEQNPKPVVVQVSAPWCGPCRKMKPLFEELSQDWSEKYTFAELNVDEERDLAIRYAVTTIPTFLFIHKDTVVGRETGSMTLDTLKSKMQSYLGA